MKTTIKISPLDAALVLRADGTLETWLPHIQEDPPPNALAASALVCAWSDDRIFSMITHAMSKSGDESPEPPPAEPAPPDPSRLQ